MHMNLPNKLTCLRALMVPFFVLFMSLSFSFRYSEGSTDSVSGVFVAMRIISLLIFIAAAFTDCLDGYIARSRGLVTDFGKFMDPLADKLLVCSALILFAAEGTLPAWAVIVIIARELVISGFRLVASDKGIVIAASMWGKVKTVTQMALCIVLIADGLWPLAESKAVTVLIALTVIFTVVSLADYVWQNRAVLTEGSF